jgi:hypothetical protein
MNSGDRRGTIPVVPRLGLAVANSFFSFAVALLFSCEGLSFFSDDFFWAKIFTETKIYALTFYHFR